MQGGARRGPEPSPSNFKHIATLEGHTHAIACVKFSPTGAFLASCGADCKVFVWDPTTFQRVRTYAGHTGGVSDIAWSHDEAHLASASDDQTIMVWSLHAGGGAEPVPRVLKGHQHHVFCLNFSPDSRELVSGCVDGIMRIWDVELGKVTREVKAHRGPVTAVEFNKEGNLVVSSGYDGVCHIWDTNGLAGGLACQTVVQTNGPCTFARFSFNGTYLLTSSLNNSLQIYKFKSDSGLERLVDQPKKEYRGHKNERHVVVAVFCTTGGTNRAYIVSGSEDHLVYVWAVNGNPEVLQTLAGHKDVVGTVDCHPKRNLIASGELGNNPSIRLWEE